MQREVLVEWISELSGQPVGARALRYGVDADEYVKKGTAKIVDEHPPPRSFLLTDGGSIEIGVMAGNQVKQTEQEREAEQQYLLAQVKSLDAKHEAEQAERRRKDAIEARKKETSRG